MIENLEKQFNIRVYALIVNDRNEILITDEYVMGTFITKFPGGGLHFGEGTIDCLKREAIEELGQEINLVRHYYTTDFFQPSVFNPNNQVISIYYLAGLKEKPAFKISNKPFDFIEEKEGSQLFRFVPLKGLMPEDLTLPIDKVVLTMLKNDFETHMFQ